MDTLFSIVWLLWAPLCAWFVRALIVRLLHRQMGGASFAYAYTFWIVSFISALVFAQWSGMQMYGFDRSDPWQLAGWIVLFISPFGLPLLFGAPVVLLSDAIRFVVIPAWQRRSGRKLPGA